jgi:NAD(P)-dependent dehydrogenase (short-subunit alcohol dehydrogenase family)
VSIEALAKHDPEHIYFTGRNKTAADALIIQVKKATPTASLTFLEMDLSSLVLVKSAAAKFAHNHLDILICNAGIMDATPALSKDGFEIHFATNHLGHAMLIRQLLPVMLRTAETPNADVRLVILTSVGWSAHPPAGIWYMKMRTKQDGILTSWARYGYDSEILVSFTFFKF